MILALVTIIAVLLTFACLVAYHYIRDLRERLERSKDNARTAWRLYDAASRELSVIKGTLTSDPYAPEPAEGKQNSSPFIPTGIGPTAINDREMRRERLEREKDYAPTPPDRHPSQEQIAAAARAASGNHGATRQ